MKETIPPELLAAFQDTDPAAEEASYCRQRAASAPTFMGRQYWLRKAAILEGRMAKPKR